MSFYANPFVQYFVLIFSVIIFSFANCLFLSLFLRKTKNIQAKKIVIIGGGTAGISTAARLAKKSGNLVEIIIIDPEDIYYYQPGFTYLGFGITEKKKVASLRSGLIPADVVWRKDRVIGVNPDNCEVTISSGEIISYDFLVIASGLKLCWDKVIGLRDALDNPSSGVISVCSYQDAINTRERINSFQGGKFISSMPSTETKCPGVSQKVILLMHDLSRFGQRLNFAIFSANRDCAIGEPYRKILEGKFCDIGTEIFFNQELVKINSDNTAVFKDCDGNLEVHKFDLLHVVPPMAVPEFLIGLTDESGFISVNHETLQHNRYANIFAVGDCANLPTRKTGAAVRKQVPVLVQNIISLIKGKNMQASYDGYSCCPIFFSRYKILMMEFNYRGVAPGLLNKMCGVCPSIIMYFVKMRVIPIIHWRFMLKGRNI